MEQTQKPKLVPRSPSYNIDSELSTKIFQRIMVRIKVHKVIKHWKKLSKNSFNRYKRIEEWVKTEKTYIDDMNLIINQIQKPLNQSNLITEEEDKILFPNLGGIIMLSEQMHLTMKGFLESWHPVKTEIAQAVIKLSNFFKIYIEYFNNYEKGKEIIAGIQQDKAFKSIEKSLKMDVASYLIKPVQRPLKYKLLLTDYQKKLRMDHPDYHALTKAIEIYHQVVEKTNQAMENEKHMKRMVQMEAKFKNILESSRQWKFEFEAGFQDQIDLCKVYVFTDLLLVINEKGSKKEELLCKMFLDASSFVEACEDVYDEKRKHILVGGREKVGHFSFQTLQERNRVFEKLSKLMNSIHVNEWKRKEEISRLESRRISSTRLSKPYFLEDYYEMFDSFKILKKKFRVTVCGVQRRVVNKCLNSYYVIKLQLPFPEVINQKAFVKLEELIDLEMILQAAMNKWALVKAEQPEKIKWKSIQHLPNELNKANNIEIDSICIEYRAKVIETFLNFILRSKQTLKTSNLIFYKLKMFESLYEKIIDDKNECEWCEICQNGNIISSYESYLEELEKRLEEKKLKKDENLCIERSFHCQNKLASLAKQKPRCTVEQILLYINSKAGMINQALTNRIIQGDPMKIVIYRPHWRDIVGQVEDKRQKWVQLEIYKRDTVGNVLELIRRQLGLNGIKDYGLFLVSNGIPFHKLLHDDEYVLDVIRQNNLNINPSSRQSFAQTKSGIKAFFSKLKDKIDTKEQSSMKLPNARIEFRKVYMFPDDIEIFTCANHTYRYQLLADEIFYLFKDKTINLHHTNIVKLCALFICIEFNSRFPYMKREEISKDILSEIIPQSRMHLVNDNFIRQIFGILTIYKEKNIRERTVFQAQVIELVKQNPGWNMQFFLVFNLIQNLTLPDQYLKIGVNWQELYILRQHNYLTPVARIKLDKLNIKFSGFLIVVLEQEREFKFICDDVFMFRCVLEKYLAYNKHFLGKDRLVGRPLMEETI